MHPVDDLVGGGDADGGESRCGQAFPVLGEGQGAGDAADVAAALGAVRFRSGRRRRGCRRRRSGRPGRSTRKLSAKTAALFPDRLITQLEMITSTVWSGSGIDSMWPLRNSTLRAPALAALSRAMLSISSVMSRPYALPAGPTRRADSSTSMPPPEPRSSTVSPGWRSATAIGLPQPRLADTAFSRHFALLAGVVQFAAGSGLAFAGTGFTAGRSPAADDGVCGLGVPGAYPLPYVLEFIWPGHGGHALSFGSEVHPSPRAGLRWPTRAGSRSACSG